MSFQPLLTRCSPCRSSLWVHSLRRYAARTVLWFDPKSSKSVAREPNNTPISMKNESYYVVLCPWGCRKSMCPLTDDWYHHRLRRGKKILNPNPEHKLANCAPRFPTSDWKFESPPKIMCRPALEARCNALSNCSKKLAKSCSE